jgi:hypothetical protein
VGSHTLEYGWQYVNSITGGENRQSPNGYNLAADADPFFAVPGPDSATNPADLRFNLRPGLITRWVALPLDGSAELENHALYVQDSWTLDKWRFDIGLRYDKVDGSGPQALDTVSFDDIAPRLGATYNIDQNWQLQATWGKYVSRMNDGVTNEVTGVDSAPRIINAFSCDPALGLTYDEVEAIVLSDACWQSVVGYTGTDIPATVLDPNLESPYANDLTLSVKRALPRNSGSITLSYVNREYKNLIDDFIGGFGYYEVPDPSGQQPNLGEGDVTFITNTSEATRRYNSLTATWDYRPAARWNVGGNWTVSKTEGNYEGEATNQPYSFSAIGDYVNSRNQQAVAPFGYLLNDARHRARSWANYRLNFERLGSLTLGTILNYVSGTPWHRTASVPQGDTPEYLQDCPGGVCRSYTYFFTRGADRFDGWWGVDLSARYQFPVYRQLNGWVKLDVTNITDNDSLKAHDVGASAQTNAAGQLVWVPSSSFGRVRNQLDYQTPRTYLVTLGLNF